MLSPITPCIFSSVENIPSLDIFAPSDNISQPGPCWPTETATGASPVANFQAAADPDTSLYPEQVKPTRERKKTACETDLELSLESGVEAQQPVTRKRSLLEGLEPPCSVKFDRILDDEDTSEANTAQFLGKRDIADFDNSLLHLSPQISRLNNHDEHSKGMLLETEQADSKKQCKMGHKMGQASQKHRECTLCKSVLGTIERFVQERNGHLVSKELDHEVVLCCENGHQWTVGYKKATKSWCKDCKSKRKQLLKEMIEEEKARIFQERRMKQEKLFEEARQHVINSKETQKQETKAELDNTKIIMDEITRIASKYAREYCQKEASAEFEQSLLLYQTLILPEKVLTTYFSSLSKVSLKSEIRRYTILLHPDKNSHPKAKQAFQKAYGLMSRQLETL